MATKLNVYMKTKKQYYQLVMMYRFIGTLDADSICVLLVNKYKHQCTECT